MRGARTIVVACTLLALSGCVVASPDADTFRDTAASTLADATSEVATVDRMVSLVRDDRITRAAVVAQLRHSESALSSASDSFLSVNVPTGEEVLAGEVADVLDEAEASLRDARQRVHRDDASGYVEVGARMTLVLDRLGALEKAVS